MTKVSGARAAGANDTTTGPERGGLVLSSLILVAAVANLNLSVANVALPSIGQAFDSSQTTLDLIAVGYSLGLAASVLYLGAVGDRYGRKLLLVLGVVLFSAALFFGGISTRLQRPRPCAVLLGVGCAVLVGTLVWVATFPVSR